MDYIKRLKEMQQIIDWWCNGMFQIGGNLGLFLRMGTERIEELYNVKFPPL